LRVSRDLHDGVNQTIASAKMRLHGVLEDGSAPMRPSAREILRRCERLLVKALEENRQIAHNLRPSDLDELGFEAACRSFCRNFGVRTSLRVKWSIPRLHPRLPAAVELNLFRILQETLNNVDKHAKAKSVRVRLAKKRGSIVLVVRDDGRGIRKNKSPQGNGNGQSGLGLVGINERAVLVGGTCQVDSIPDQGTTVTVTVPCTLTPAHSSN
jgi:signal transduction histidine kinase